VATPPLPLYAFECRNPEHPVGRRKKVLHRARGYWRPTGRVLRRYEEVQHDGARVCSGFRCDGCNRITEYEAVAAPEPIRTHSRRLRVRVWRASDPADGVPV